MKKWLKKWWLNKKIRHLNNRQIQLVEQCYIVRQEITDLDIYIKTLLKQRKSYD